MIQQNLFEQPDERRPDPPPQVTKRPPADQSPEYAQRLKDQILAYFREQGERGVCDFEGQAALGIEGDSYRSKRKELQTEGLIVKTERTRLSTRNRAAHVRVLAKYATPAEPKPKPKPQPTRDLPITPAKQKIRARSAVREQRFGPMLDAMPPNTLEAFCIQIFPAWPRIIGLGPYHFTPEAARRNETARPLLLAAIEDDVTTARSEGTP